MLLVLVVLFVVAPIVELAVIVQVAHGIGVGNTILLLIAVSVLGSWLCKREGLSTWRRIQTSLQRHEVPTRDLVDGGLILFAGSLLIAPGFISDVLGVLLLLPPTRAVFRAIVLRAIERRSRFVTVISGFGGPGGGPGGFPGGGRGPGGPTGYIDTTGADER